MLRKICGWLGHRESRSTRVWFVRPEYRSIHVADELVEERFSCFCNKEDSGWKEVDRSGINSLAISSDMWARLRRDGKVLIQG